MPAFQKDKFMPEEMDMQTTPVEIEIDAQTVTPESGDHVEDSESDLGEAGELGEGDEWQATEPEQEQAQTELEAVQAAAALETLSEESNQTALEVTQTELLTQMQQQLAQIPESLSAAMEAQTRAITELANELRSTSRTRSSRRQKTPQTPKESPNESDPASTGNKRRKRSTVNLFRRKRQA